VRLAHRDGSVKQYTLPLPPVLLPGHYEWPLPGARPDVTTVSLAGNELALAPSPATLAGKLAAGPQLVASVPSGETLAGSTLICQVYGKGPIDRPGLILSVNLVDEQFKNYAKHDIFFDASMTPPDKWNATTFTRAPCSLDLPADLPPGTYYLAIGLFDPAAQQFVPIADANGAPVATAWRVPQPMVVK
jgi:hypothetical protein